IPIREALRILEASGWVNIRPRYGVYVKTRDKKELASLFEMREILEPAITRLAAQRRSARDLEGLMRLVEEGDEASKKGNPSEFASINSQFHHAIVVASKNLPLIKLYDDLQKQVRFYLTGIPVDRLERSAEEHR